MTRAQQVSTDVHDDLKGFACPNEDCTDFNVFGGDNLSVCERMGRDKRIRRLYCKSCGQRFSERQGSLLAHTKLPEEQVVRIVKCLGHGCSIEATADICEVDSRTVELLLAKAGERAEQFHRLSLDNLPQPPAIVEVDELHASLIDRAQAHAKKGEPVEQLAAILDARAARGSTLVWP
jgi:transposase-like protein